MTGIYIHIPFCASRCIYCNFYSTTRRDERQHYVDALCREMELRPVNDSIATLYLGGGTPSQLSPQQLQQLFDRLYIIYKVEDAAEVTIECNPDDVTEDFAGALASLPVNRVSMGVQTFDDQRLRFLHRRHNASQVPIAIDRLRKVGIHNISIDLMYGFPEETLEDWQQDIKAAVKQNVEHLSAYCLSIEEGTPLYKMHLPAADEEIERQMYELLIDNLTIAGYEHYEISNFARHGFRSRHNSSYWKDVPYIGLGAAAHSYDLKHRRWNPDDLSIYMKGIEADNPIFEQETLDAVTRYNDRVMLSLRTCEGVSLDALSIDDRRYLLTMAAKYVKEGLLKQEEGRLFFSRQGLFVSDMVMSDLMRV